ncbi:MAG: cell wall-binding repeat-containing protein [Acidimicrobiaceae bacterium]|nr:cell wall-binding repeat-containing protein [Acidimicrobiaceae bacterium]
MRRLAALVLSVAVGFGSVLVVPADAAGAAEEDDSTGSDGSDVSAGSDGSDGSDVSVARYGGADRYATSLLIAEAVAAEAGGSLEWAVLVSGERWTDAVVAAPLAGSLGAPVLMTPPGELRADAAEFLGRVGVTDAVVVGPDASGGAHGPGRGVGAAVLEALGEAGISASRVAGDDRYSTGVAAAGQVAAGPGTAGLDASSSGSAGSGSAGSGTAGVMPGLGRTAILASGEVFADALVAGPFAARGRHPVLLTPPGELHADVADYLSSAGIEHVVLMGGTAALSETVEQSVTDLGVSVSRISGSTRYDTAVKAGELVADRYSDTASQTCFDNSTIGLARARVPFDSFSAAPLLARLCAPLVLADPGRIPPDTAGYLDAAREAHDAVDLRVFGGDAAVSGAAITAYLAGEDSDGKEGDKDGDGDGEDDSDEDADDDDADGDSDEDSDGEDSEDAEDEDSDGDSDDGASTLPGVLPAGTCGGTIDDEPTQLVPSTNAEDPAWSPDCSRLVYTQGGSLWLVNNDGTNRTMLVPNRGAYLNSAAWSPQGDRIAYVRGYQDGNHWTSHIWTVNTDGTHNNQRTEGDVRDRWPTWSPDGKWIAYESQTGSGRDDAGQRIDRDDHIVVMTSFGNKPRTLNPGGPAERSPAWSPDGSQIAYYSSGYIVLADTEGHNARRLHTGAYWNGGLSWSPDGTRIAFVRGDRTQASLVIADIAGPGEAVVYATDSGTGTFAPRWSPDGQRIVFHTIDQDGRHRVYVAGASGSPAPTATDCRPAGKSGTTTGFPLPHWAPRQPAPSGSPCSSWTSPTPKQPTPPSKKPNSASPTPSTTWNPSATAASTSSSCPTTPGSAPNAATKNSSPPTSSTTRPSTPQPSATPSTSPPPASTSPTSTPSWWCSPATTSAAAGSPTPPSPPGRAPGPQRSSTAAISARNASPTNGGRWPPTSSPTTWACQTSTPTTARTPDLTHPTARHGSQPSGAA